MFFSFELPPTLQQIMAVSESWTAWTKEIRRKRQKDTKTKSSIAVPRGWTLGLHNVFMYCSTGLKPIDLQSNIFATRWLCRVVSLASATTKAVSMEELIRESLLEFVREEVVCFLNWMILPFSVVLWFVWVHFTLRLFFCGQLNFAKMVANQLF